MRKNNLSLADYLFFNKKKLTPESFSVRFRVYSGQLCKNSAWRYGHATRIVYSAVVEIWMNYGHFKTFAWGAVKKTHADSNILSRTALNPSNDIVKRRIWIIPHSEKNIWIKEVFAGFFTFENTALSCALFAIYEQQ